MSASKLSSLLSQTYEPCHQSAVVTTGELTSMLMASDTFTGARDTFSPVMVVTVRCIMLGLAPVEQLLAMVRLDLCCPSKLASLAQMVQ